MLACRTGETEPHGKFQHVNSWANDRHWDDSHAQHNQYLMKVLEKPCSIDFVQISIEHDMKQSCRMLLTLMTLQSIEYMAWNTAADIPCESKWICVKRVAQVDAVIRQAPVQLLDISQQQACASPLHLGT